jgi:hypothetical protein
MPLIEVRDYHYDPDRMDDYRAWAAEAGPFLCDRFDAEGFWIDAGEPGMLFGADPREHPHGPANVTWVIRWEDRSQRDAAWDALWEDDTWNDLWERHPGFEGYRQLSVRFLTEVSAP